VIEVRNLSKYFGNRCAVNSISFTVDEGQIVGFLGPNGAGKTTTLRVLTCYHPASSGSASIAGCDVFTQSMQVRRVVGYLPESVPLYLEMRVHEYLNFRGKLRRMDRAAREAAIARVAERCWLGDVIGRPIGQLSKGYRQRVGLADALLHNPSVLILDEPTIGLDPAQIRETRALIRELAREHTVLFSSHILSEVEATSQRIILIHRGQLIASGTADELKSRVSSEWRLVAELKGPSQEISESVRKLNGVGDLRTESKDGWTRVSLTARSDLRPALHELSTQRHWPLRELRRELPTLEDFFVKAVLESRGDDRGERKD
jgi:ABC-2 type transport system ATP-binding protein